MTEKGYPRRPGRRHPEDNVFDWFIEAWRKRYESTDFEATDQETLSQEILSAVCHENCLDPDKEQVRKLNESARKVVREEVGLELLPTSHEIHQAG